MHCRYRIHLSCLLKTRISVVLESYPKRMSAISTSTEGVGLACGASQRTKNGVSV